MNIYEEFQVHDTLNPKLWEGDTLKPQVRQKTVEIVAAFEDYIDIPIRIADVQLCGSNASFNYTEESDLDVHIIANFEAIPAPTELLHAAYNSAKASFNDNYNIKIYGIDVELYVQNILSNVVSNGIYSICSSEWIKEPKPLSAATKHNIDKEVAEWRRKAQLALASKDADEVLSAIDLIYLLRKNSLAVEGEYGKGNEIFKELRRSGVIEQLKKAARAAESKQLSLESYRGSFISRYDI